MKRVAWSTCAVSALVLLAGALTLAASGQAISTPSFWSRTGPDIHNVNAGNVGIGLATPQERLHVMGEVRFQGQSTLNLQTGAAGRVQISAGADDLILNPVAGARVGIGTTSPQTTLDVNGAITIRGGSDLAEPFETLDDVVPGALMCIDPEHPGKLRLAREAYDTTVAGIVSGAGGVRPGMMMFQEEELDGSHPIAVAGRVYCWADASFGAITAGDLLTTSPTPGHAMKAADRARANGCLVGKALSSLEEGKGLVLVLVGLQ